MRHENGQYVADRAHELGTTPTTFYAWRKMFTSMDATHIKRLKEPEAENAKLKRMYAELVLDNVAIKYVVSK